MRVMTRPTFSPSMELAARRDFKFAGRPVRAGEPFDDHRAPGASKATVSRARQLYEKRWLDPKDPELTRKDQRLARRSAPSGSPGLPRPPSPGPEVESAAGSAGLAGRFPPGAKVKHFGAGRFHVVDADGKKLTTTPTTKDEATRVLLGEVAAV